MKTKQQKEEAQKALLVIGIIEKHLINLKEIKNESVALAIDTIIDDFRVLQPMILEEFKDGH